MTAAGEDEEAKRACLAPDNHFDAIVALNIATGAIRWATHALPYDTWNVNCLDIPGFPVAGECPDPAGPDYDFGQGPALFTAKLGGKTRDLVGAGQKSGKYWTLDRDTGQVIWVTQVDPGGTMGGLQWGSAVDDKRIYVAVNNSGLAGWTPLGATTSTNRGAWSALDKATGQILWQTETPDPAISGLGSAIGAVTVANGVACAWFAADHHRQNQYRSVPPRNEVSAQYVIRPDGHVRFRCRRYRFWMESSRISVDDSRLTHA